VVQRLRCRRVSATSGDVTTFGYSLIPAAAAREIETPAHHADLTTRSPPALMLAARRGRGTEKTMKVTGGCHCGQITYGAEVDPTTVRVCHCTDCQRLTGTAFRTNISSLPGTFVLKSGAPKIYIKTAESVPWGVEGS
jgi:hypothetical protein